MINWRLAVPAVVGAAVVAGCISYVVVPTPSQQVEAGQQLRPTLPTVADHVDTAIQHPTTDEHITAYQLAAEAILKRAQNAQASAVEPPITGQIPPPKSRIPLPKKRPIPR